MLDSQLLGRRQEIRRDAPSLRNTDSQKWYLSLLSYPLVQNLLTWSHLAPGRLGSVVFIPGGPLLTFGISVGRRGEEVLGISYSTTPKPKGNSGVLEGSGIREKLGLQVLPGQVSCSLRGLGALVCYNDS